jgi:hypothetical protein
MLQMLNLDVKKANDGPNTHFPEGGPHIHGEHSDDDLIHSHSNYNKKELILPSVVASGSYGKGDINISADNIKDGSGDEGNDPYKPKV